MDLQGQRADKFLISHSDRELLLLQYFNGDQNGLVSFFLISDRPDEKKILEV